MSSKKYDSPHALSALTGPGGGDVTLIPEAAWLGAGPAIEALLEHGAEN